MSGLSSIPGPVLLAFFAASLGLACSSDDGVAPDPDVAFLVGDWHATRFVIGIPGAPEQALDLIAEGASFTLNVQPSGHYTAILTVPGLPPNPPELGRLSVDGDELVFRRTTPPAAITRAGYERVASDRVRFGGPSELDLNGDGTAESITLDVEIVREE